MRYASVIIALSLLVVMLLYDKALYVGFALLYLYRAGALCWAISMRTLNFGSDLVSKATPDNAYIAHANQDLLIIVTFSA